MSKERWDVLPGPQRGTKMARLIWEANWVTLGRKLLSEPGWVVRGSVIGETQGAP